MKRICHITTVHNRYDTRIFQKQCVSLSANGYEVFLLCADGKNKETIKGVKIESISSHYSNPIIRILFSPYKMFSLAISKDADIPLNHI